MNVHELLSDFYIVKCDCDNFKSKQTCVKLPFVSSMMYGKREGFVINTSLSRMNCDFVSSIPSFNFQIFNFEFSNNGHSKLMDIIGKAYFEEHKIILFIYDEDSVIKSFLNLFFRKFAGGNQYISNLGDIISMNTGFIFN
jgi:hypothetical protein